MKYEIKNKQAYHSTMVEIYELMEKGSEYLTASQLKKLESMSVAAEKFEDEVLNLRPKKMPETITEFVELKLFEEKMTQAKLADKIGIGKSKLSEILSGKRKPDLPFLKGVYQVLKIDADFLLKHS